MNSADPAEQTVIEDGSYTVKAESENSQLSPKEEADNAQIIHNGEEIAYKITYHAGQEGDQQQSEVILDGTRIIDESGQQYIYQNGDGGNLYVISTVTTGEDGIQQEGQLIATSAELFSAAGGAQIVNINNLAELGIGTNPSELLDGQHIIINGQQMILQNGGISIDESYANNHAFMEQEVIIDGSAEVEVSDGLNSEHLMQSSMTYSSTSRNTQKTSGKATTMTTPAISAGPPLIKLEPLPPNQTPADLSSYDETISSVIKQSLYLAEQERLDKERQLQIERIAARAAAPKVTSINLTPSTSFASPATVTSANVTPPTIPGMKPVVIVSTSSPGDPPQISLSELRPIAPAQSQAQTPVQQHTVIMVKDKRKRIKLEKDPMSLPFSYAGQSFNVQAQKLILNVMHFFKTHKNDEFIDSIKTPQEKAARVLNVSSSVIGKIRKNYKLGRLEHPGKKRQMTKRVLDKVNTGDEEIIRKIIKDLSTRRVTPTIPMILAEAREKIGFTGSRTSFRRILHRMGYKYGKVERKIVMLEDGQVKPEPGTSSSPRPPTIPGLGSTSLSTSTSMPGLPKLIATGGAYTRPRIQLTPISSATPNLHLTSLARPPSVQYTPLARPPNIQLAPLSKQAPAQIQVIKHEATSAPQPIVLNNGSGNNFVVNNSISQPIQQPRQIIIQQSSSPSHQQFYAIQPHQLSQMTNSSGQPQIIRIIQSNQRTQSS